jgi:hypothetical protein
MTSMIFNIKQGDLLPVIQATALQADGTPLNLTGATVVFRMRKHLATTWKVNSAGAVVTPASGIVSYTWIAGDTDTVGVYEAEFLATIGGKPQTLPTVGFMTVNVLDGGLPG